MQDATPMREALAGRYDLYGPIHKGLRFAFSNLLIRVGSADFTAGPQPELLAELRAQLALCAKHLEHEELHIHPLLEAVAPGATVGTEGEHQAHRRAFATLERAIAAVEAAESAARPALARALYLALSELVAEDLAHMHREETVIWPALCAAFTDAELAAIEAGILAGLPPEVSIAFLKLMIPAMNPDERAALLGGMKADAPAEVFQAVLQEAARPTLSARDYAQLDERLAA